jgi:hypothetical protein
MQQRAISRKDPYLGLQVSWTEKGVYPSKSIHCLTVATPFVGIVNSDVGILNACREILCYLGVKYRDCNKALTEGEFKGSLDCRNLRIDGQQPVECLIKAVLPYLRSVKKQYAKKVLEYLESRKINGLQRDELGRIRRCEYSRAEIELISSIRTHKRAKSSEAICQAPNVLG